MAEIYIVHIQEAANEEDIRWLEDHVPLYRRKKAEQYRFEKDRIRSLLGGILPVLYGKLHHITFPEECEINKYGKPSCKQEGFPEYNLSHSGEWAACGFDDMEIGIDIEEIRPIDPEGIASQFAPEEYGYIMSAPKEERVRRMIRIWTLKESYSKCLGLGLSLPMNSYSTYLEEEFSREEFNVTYKDGTWLKQKKLGDRYYLSECSRTGGDMVIRRFTLREIQNCLYCL